MDSVVHSPQFFFLGFVARARVCMTVWARSHSINMYICRTLNSLHISLLFFGISFFIDVWRCWPDAVYDGKHKRQQTYWAQNRVYSKYIMEVCICNYVDVFCGRPHGWINLYCRWIFFYLLYMTATIFPSFVQRDLIISIRAPCITMSVRIADSINSMNVLSNQLKRWIICVEMCATNSTH